MKLCIHSSKSEKKKENRPQENSFYIIYVKKNSTTKLRNICVKFLTGIFHPLII